MAGTGVAIALVTLPFVGIEAWIDWFKIGRVASETYDVDPAWIPLSRDLLGIPRRFLIDFENPDYYHRDRWYIQLAGWSLLVMVLETTIRLTQLIKVNWRATTGPAAAFVLLGAWLCCFHFMYYDVLLSAIGVIVLIADPGKFIRPLFILIRPRDSAGGPDQAWKEYLRPRLARAHPALAAPGSPPPGILWVANSFLLYALFTLIFVNTVFQYLGVTATFHAAHFKPVTVTTTSEAGPIDKIGPDGQPVTKRLQLEVTTNQVGPAWDTFVLLGIWIWSGAYVLTRFGARGHLPADIDSG
jgi:hypothetical protein